MMQVLTQNWRRIGIVAIGLSLTFLFSPHVLAEDGAKTPESYPCKQADALLSLKIYGLAKTEYSKVLARISVNSDCAKLGLEKIKVLEVQARGQAQQQYLVGFAYAKAERFDEAIKAYLSALSIDPTFQDAQTTLDQALINYQIASVESLVQQGLYTQAKARLENIQTGHSITIPEHLQFLNQSPISQWLQLRRANQGWQLWLEILTACLIIIITPPVIYLVIRWRLFPWIQGIFLLRLEIQSFEDGSKDRLQFGRGVTSMVQEAIQIYDAQSERADLKLVVGSIETFGIPSELANLTPSLAILNALIAWLVPPNILIVSGYLQYSESRGAGLTIAMIEKRTGKSSKLILSGKLIFL